MSATLRLTCLTVAALLAACAVTQAQTKSKGIKLGEDFEGELGGEKQTVGVAPSGHWQGRRWGKLRMGFATDLSACAYVAEVSVTLKAGQKVVITATVKGTDRKVSVLLEDKNGEVAGYVKTPAKKEVELAIDEFNATGTYKVFVISDRTGAFTLRVDTPSGKGGDKLDEKALKAKIKALKKELAELEEKLEALQEKKEKSLSK